MRCRTGGPFSMLGVTVRGTSHFPRHSASHRAQLHTPQWGIRLSGKPRPNLSAEQERISYLEKKIQTTDEVLAELMASIVAQACGGSQSIQ
jgi:hypothetical protein